MDMGMNMNHDCYGPSARVLCWRSCFLDYLRWLKYHSYQHFLSESPTAIRSIIVVGGSLSIVFVPYSQRALLFKSSSSFFLIFLPGALTANKPLFSLFFFLFLALDRCSASL